MRNTNNSPFNSDVHVVYSLFYIKINHVNGTLDKRNGQNGNN